MAVNLISFPFRLHRNGRLATVEQDSDDHHAEEIAVICMSRPNERDLVPDFGINDPAYETLHREELEAQVEMFEVPVSIAAVEVEDVDDTKQDVTIHFE